SRRSSRPAAALPVAAPSQTAQDRSRNAIARMAATIRSWGGRRMLSRRNFLGSTLAAGAALTTQGSPMANAQARKRTIVDAQIHLWKAESEDWKWIPGARPQMPEPFTIEKAVPLMDEAGVDRAVIVPPSWPGDRNDYALEAVKS